MSFLRLTRHFDEGHTQTLYVNEDAIECFWLKEVTLPKGNNELLMCVRLRGERYADIIVREDLRQFVDLKQQMTEDEARAHGYIK